jgi:hypothetical protein
MTERSSAVSDPALIGEIIEMALSDHTSFDAIRQLHGMPRGHTAIFAGSETCPHAP